MNFNRSKNTLRNIVSGFINCLINLVVPFLLRTVMIKTIGVEYLGLSSLFTSILNVLNLSELGFGTAMVYCMYRPIAEGDKVTVCSLLKFYKSIYTVISIFIAGVGLGLLPFLDQLIAGEIPEGISIYVVYLIFLCNTVSSYAMLAYRNSILIVNQRNDVSTNVQSVLRIVLYSLQFLFLILFKNYYLYIIFTPILTILTNLITAYYVKKMYPQYVCMGRLNVHMIKQICAKALGLMGGKISSVVLNSADNIVLSSALGLTVVAIYNNYYYVVSSLTLFVAMVFSSMTAGLGNSLIVESKEKNYNDFKVLFFTNNWLISWCSICMLCLYQPFMELWMGKDYLFPFSTVILFSIYFYVYLIQRVANTYKDAAGLWWDDLKRSIVANVFNVIGNIVLVRIWGVNGVIISTIISLGCITLPWMTSVVIHKIFNRGTKEYYCRLGMYSILLVIVGTLTLYITRLIPFAGYGGFVLKGMICIIIPNMIYLVVFHRTNEFIYFRNKLKQIITRRKN